MVGFGAVLFGLGVLGALVSLGMDVSVPERLTSVLGSGARGIVNLDLVSMRTVAAVLSGSLIVSGSVLIGSGAIVARLDRQGPRPAEPAARRDEPRVDADPVPVPGDLPEGIERTADGRYRVGEREFGSLSDAEALLDLMGRQRR